MMQFAINPYKQLGFQTKKQIINDDAIYN